MKTAAELKQTFANLSPEALELLYALIRPRATVDNLHATWNDDAFDDAQPGAEEVRQYLFDSKAFVEDVYDSALYVLHSGWIEEMTLLDCTSLAGISDDIEIDAALAVARGQDLSDWADKAISAVINAFDADGVVCSTDRDDLAPLVNL